MTEAVKRGVPASSVIEIGHTAYPVIASDSSVGAGLQLMLAAGERTLRLAVQRSPSDRRETVHRFRIALRRSRSVLSAFGKVLPEHERHLLGERLSGITKRYGRAREWDVFLTDIVTPLAKALPGESSVTELRTAAQAARRKALPDHADLRGEANDVIAVIGAADWLHRPQPRFEMNWHSDLKDFATETARRRVRTLKKRLKTVDLTDQDSFHELRIKIKKTRYPIEMFSNLFEPDAVKSYLRRLVAVQDALGHLNDAIVAGDLVAELSLSTRTQGIVGGWLAREIEARRDGFARPAKKLRHAEPFWEN